MCYYQNNVLLTVMQAFLAYLCFYMLAYTCNVKRADIRLTHVSMRAMSAHA